MKSIIRILPFYFALLLPIELTAREPSVRLLADRVAAELGQVHLVAGKKKSHPLSIPINTLSDDVVVPDRTFEVRSVEGGEALATINLPAKGKEFIVLLSSIEKGFEPAVIPADDRSFKKGDIYFFNNSGETIAGVVGGIELEIPAGDGVIVHPKAEASKVDYPVSLKVREDSGDRVLSSATWPVEENMRSYVFFFVDPKKERISFRSVDEFVEE